MIWMRSTELMRKYVELWRCDMAFPLILAFVTATVLVLTNLFMVFLKESDNLEKFFLAAKDFAIVLALFSCVIRRFLKPEDTIRVTKVIEEEFFIDRFQLEKSDKKWKKIRMLYDEKRKDMESASETIIVLVYSTVFLFDVKYILLGLFGASLEVEDRGFPTPFATYSPSEFDQIAFLIYMFALQSFFVLFLSHEGFIGYASLWLSVKKIIADFETIYLLIHEIVNDYPGFAVEDYLESLRLSQQEISSANAVCAESIQKYMRLNVQHNQKLNWYDDVAREEKLRKDMRLIVQFHQNLNRNQEYCARVSGYNILVFSVLVALDTCFNFFLMLQANTRKMFMYYATACICINIPLLLNYYIGQQISNQNEIFRQHLAELPWIDKPQWFKQSMLIMMIRANIDTEIKPYGVFDLNLTSFKDLMKAAFSFGNVFYQRKQTRK